MENRPVRIRPAQAGSHPRGGPTGEDGDTRLGREETPLPLPKQGEQENWAAMGSTRIIQSVQGAHEDSPPESRLAVPTPPKETQAEDLVIGDFRLLAKVGEGAMGAVYKAHQISFNRDVALKVLFKHIANNPKLVERMYREGLVMGQLDHANIVRGYGVGEDHGWHYMAMELIDGSSLQKWLDRLGKLSVGDAVHILLACARGLQYAHELDIIHRDIKPDNILITREGEVKVADLGMVKLLDEDMSLTQTGHAVGTPWYMPLEQAKNAKETDGRCDIYAMGCMLYCLLTGKPPFAGHTLVEVIQAKEIGTFPPARQANAEVPERLDLIIAKMAAKLPRYRYQNCAELIKDLEGLGLANARLEFLHEPVKKARSAASKSTMVDPPLSVAKEEQEAVADVWYLRYKKPAGQIVVRKMTTNEVLEYLGNPSFDRTAQASHHSQEGFRALGTYKEFEHLALGRTAKKTGSKKAAQYQSLYKKIDDQERNREEVKDKEVTTSSYWMGIVLKYLPWAIGAGLVLLVLWYLARGLG